MQLARGSWLVIGLVGGAIVLAIIGLILRPVPRPADVPAATQTVE